ncbi:MAG: zinc transporter ZupT [Promethearchaeota archaeon]|nr:MAG: zinc transporter ZupT [Candidatus Lokiarchaeota archaeon]
MKEVWTALILTSIAGLSTTIGAFLGIINRKPSPRFVSFILATSGGVMVFLSFVEMFIPAWESTQQGYALLFLGIGLGIGFIFDMLLPEDKNVHEHIFNGTIVHNEEGEPILQTSVRKEHHRGHKHFKRGGRARRGGKECKQMYCIDEEKYMKLGILTVLALFLHNLPEGLATFSSTLLDPKLGVEIAIATAMHNIPEGISVAIPIYLATKNKKKAVFYAFISGLAEPVGGLIAYGILLPFIQGPAGQMVLNFMLALTAGIMIYISVDVLIPTAKSIEYKHTMIIGFTLGMLVIGITIVFLNSGG